MPIRKQDYPENWREISLAVRTEAGNCCEWCQVPNKAVIQRKAYRPGVIKDWVPVVVVINHENMYERTEHLKWSRLRFHGLTRIVLTVAHLDRNSHNNDRNNLAALCQRCHLRHDIYQHIANRKYGRHHTREQQLKLPL